MLTDPKKRQLGRIIRDKRKRLGIGQSELGKMVWTGPEVTEAALQARVSRVETGRYTPSPIEVLSILDALEIEISDLIGDEEQEEKPMLSRAVEERYPELAAYVGLLNTYLMREEVEKADAIYHTMCVMLSEYSHKLKCLDSAPFGVTGSGRHDR